MVRDHSLRSRVLRTTGALQDDASHEIDAAEG